MRCDLEASDVERTQIKTTNFNARPDYDYVKGKQVFRGYVTTHGLTLELPLDQDLLNRTLAGVARSVGEPSVSIAFDVSDKEPLQRRVLQATVANARGNAATLADAAGVGLGEIIRIEYAALEVRFRSRRALYDSTIMAEEAAPDVTPSTLDAEDTVTVVWRIA